LSKYTAETTPSSFFQNQQTHNKKKHTKNPQPNPYPPIKFSLPGHLFFQLSALLPLDTSPLSVKGFSPPLLLCAFLQVFLFRFQIIFFPGKWFSLPNLEVFPPLPTSGPAFDSAFPMMGFLP